MTTATATITAPTGGLPFEIVSSGDRLLAQLLRIRDSLVEKTEEISLCLEHQMDPTVAASLKGEEQAKARHLFVSQARKIDADLNQLLVRARQFQVHIY